MKTACPCGTRARSPTRPPSRAPRRATRTRRVRRSPNAWSARRAGAASIGRPGGPSWGMAPPGSGPGRRILPRGHSNRGSLPCEGTPQRGGPAPVRSPERPRRRLGHGAPRRARRRAAPPDRGRVAGPVPRAPPCCHAHGSPEVHRLSLGQPPPHALPDLPRPGAVYLDRCRGSRLQSGHRHPAQARGHALDGPGCNAIIALRCCKLSGRFEDFWERSGRTPGGLVTRSHKSAVHPSERAHRARRHRHGVRDRPEDVTPQQALIRRMLFELRRGRADAPRGVQSHHGARRSDRGRPMTATP